MIDYAMPMMKIEQLMRKIHDACLMQQYAKAEDDAGDLIIEAQILLNNLKLMQE
jgi:hypothetical protein